MNKDQSRRDSLLRPFWSNHPEYYGGISHFQYLTSDVLNQLFEEGFIEPADCQNNGPLAEEYRQFLLDHPNFTVHGYAVDVERYDYRITIEGLECNGGYSVKDMEDFVEFEKYADELKVRDGLFSWWD